MNDDNEDEWRYSFVGRWDEGRTLVVDDDDDEASRVCRRLLTQPFLRLEAIRTREGGGCSTTTDRVRAHTVRVDAMVPWFWGTGVAVVRQGWYHTEGTRY